MSWLLIMLTACHGGGAALPPASPDAPSPKLDQVGSGPPIRLDSLLHQAEVNLPGSNLPTGQGGLAQVPLPTKWKKTRKLGGQGDPTWSAASPVQLFGKRQSARPTGLELYRGQSRLSYSCNPRGRTEAWCIDDDRLLVRSELRPDSWEQPLRIEWDEASTILQRMDPSYWTGEAWQQLPYELTLLEGRARVTRTGMLLPAPGSVSWTVTLPPDATLDLGVALVPLRMRGGPTSNGVRLEVLVNDEQVASQSVSSGDDNRDMRVDLSKWGEQEISLTLRSDPQGDPAFDYLFVAAPQVWGRPADTVRRVLVVGLDTTRYTSMTQHGYKLATTDSLDEFASGSFVFDSAFTPAPRTRPSFRTATTGRRPIAAINATSIGQVMRDAGFATAGFTANVHLQPRFDFNEGYDLWMFQNALDAGPQVERVKDWMSQNQDRDTMVFMHLMDPHNFYTAPFPYTNRYVQSDPGPLHEELNRWQIAARQGQLTPENHQWLESRYDGEMDYMADELSDFLAWVSALPGETVIVVHSDHGEEFWEHGGYEHNHTLYQELVQAVLWIRPPNGWKGGPHRVSEPVALMDIAPTLYDLVGIPEDQRPPVDGLSLRPLLDEQRADQRAELQQTLTDRPIPIGHLMYDTERWAVVSHGRKYILETMTGNEELYDLGADPGEQNDLAPSAPREDIDIMLVAMEQAFGWPAGPGWLVKLKAGRAPFVLRFPEPIEAGVIDPEAGRSRRANIEWGEVARHLPDDVATLQLSADKRSLTVTPGKLGRGTVAIKLGTWDGSAELVVTGKDGEQKVADLTAEGGNITLETVRLEIQPSAVILQRESVRDQMSQDDSADEEQLELLRRLGYIDDDH